MERAPRHSSAALMASLPKIDPPDRFCLRPVRRLLRFLRLREGLNLKKSLSPPGASLRSVRTIARALVRPTAEGRGCRLPVLMPRTPKFRSRCLGPPPPTGALSALWPIDAEARRLANRCGPVPRHSTAGLKASSPKIDPPDRFYLRPVRSPARGRDGGDCWFGGLRWRVPPRLPHRGDCRTLQREVRGAGPGSSKLFFVLWTERSQTRSFDQPRVGRSDR